MHRKRFAGVAEDTKKKHTSCAPLLAEVEAVIAWARWGKRIEMYDLVVSQGRAPA